mgnify:CR=1 FL=1
MPYASTFQGLYTVAAKEGIYKGLYKGWTVTSARSAVLTSAQLGSYDTIKNNICKRYLGLNEGFALHFTSSMLAGILTATAANPFDTIKSRYMSDHVNAYSSVIDCAVKSYHRDGMKVFLQGW